MGFALEYVLAAVFPLFIAWMSVSSTFKLRHIPTVGTSLPILSYVNGLKFRKNAREWIREGYAKYTSRGGIFKIAMTDQWLVLVSEPTLIDELRKLPDDVASIRGGINERIAGQYILGDAYRYEDIHVSIVQNKVAHTYGDKFDAIKDEIWHGFEDAIGSRQDWLPVKVVPMVVRIVMRTTNRVYLGAPLCHDALFLSAVDRYRLDTFNARHIVNLFPSLFKPIAARVLEARSVDREPIYDFLRPIIRERRNQLEQQWRSNESWSDKPDDLITWMLEEAMQKGISDDVLIIFFLLAETVAIDTTSSSFVHALHSLAANPSMAEPLRQEVAAALVEDGGEWKRGTVNKLYMMDSFLRESQRLNGNFTTTVWRKALKPITFSNGVTIPKGTFLCAATAAAHVDNTHYEDPDVFNPWRFVQSKSLVTTGIDYLPFGHGRHACPGRHFAAMEMKLMMAYIVLNYDVKLQSDDEAKRPERQNFSHNVLPDPSAKVMFRSRKLHA